MNPSLDRPSLVSLYRWMLITRGLEEIGHRLYKQGKIPGSFYTGRGNEAASVGVAAAMGPDDVGAPLHRNLGVHITRGTEPWRILANYLGRVDGPSRGRDGNVHFAELDRGQITIVSHLPAMLPVVVGCALAFRIRGEAPRGGGMVRRRSLSTRGLPRSDEPRSRASLAGRVHLRQQPVGLLDTNASRIRHRAAGRPSARIRIRGHHDRRHRCPRRLPRGAKSDRESPRRRRTNLDRIDDAPHGGTRSPRRRRLRARNRCSLPGQSATRSDATRPGSQRTPTSPKRKTTTCLPR